MGDADAGSFNIDGRQVVIYPTGYDNSPITRGEDEYVHQITVDVLERYDDQPGDAPRDWITTRVDFVYEKIVQGFDFSHDGPPTFNRKLITRSAAVSVVDLSSLLGRNRLFFSRVELVFQEVRNA